MLSKSTKEFLMGAFARMGRLEDASPGKGDSCQVNVGFLVHKQGLDGCGLLEIFNQCLTLGL